ncbi:MAG: hypothetical protein QM578_15835 [Pantoea sp.]|uniref:hypothetical protein n=1 Tax=Pantoea sp. TaxID=69393 RepID=UPI0039E69F10
MKVDGGILTSAAALMIKVANNTSEMAKRIDRVMASAVRFNSNYSRSLAENSRQTFRLAADDIYLLLRRYAPDVPAVAGKTFSRFAAFIGATTQDTIAPYIDIPKACDLLNCPDAQKLLTKLLTPSSAPAAGLSDLIAARLARVSETASIIVKCYWKDLPVHLEIDEATLSQLIEIIRPAAKRNALDERDDENHFRLACRAFLAGQVGGTSRESDLFAILMAREVATLADPVAQYLAGRSVVQQVTTIEPSHGDSSGFEEHNNSTQLMDKQVLPETGVSFASSGEKAIGHPDRDFRLYIYDRLIGFQHNAPSPDKNENRASAAFVVPAGSCMSFIREKIPGENAVCTPAIGQRNDTLPETFPGGGTMITRFGPGGSGRHFIEEQVTADILPLAFFGIVAGEQSGMEIIANTLMPGDRLEVIRSDVKPGIEIADLADSGVNNSLSDIMNTWLTSGIHISERLIAAPFILPTRWGVMADTSVNGPADAEKIAAEMQLIGLNQSTLSPANWTSPNQPTELRTQPFFLHMQANGSLVFQNHTEINLDEYALNATPRMGTQSTPLRPDQDFAYFNMKSPEQHGSKVFQVVKYRFPVSKILPMSLTAEGLDPIELIRIPATADTPSTITVAPQDQHLRQFLQQFYTARGKITGSVTAGGDGLIHRGEDMWCLIDERLFPVRIGRNGEYFIPIPSTRYLSRHAKNPEAMRKRLDDLNLTAIRVIKTDNGFQMQPGKEHGISFLKLLSQAGLYGVTTEHGVSSAHGFRLGGVTFPYEENILATIGYVAQPAILDPQGTLPAVPVKWHLHVGFGGETGFYALRSAQVDDDAIRTTTLDDLTLEQKIGFLLKFGAIVLEAPFSMIRELWRDAMGDVQSRKNLFRAVMNDSLPEDDSAGATITSVMDFIYSAVFSSNEGYIITTTGMIGMLRRGGKMLLDQPMSKDEIAGTVQVLSSLRTRRGIFKTGKAQQAGTSKNSDHLSGQRFLEQTLIINQLRKNNALPFVNAMLHEKSGTLWLYDALTVGEAAEGPIPLERTGDLFIRTIPEEVLGLEQERYLSEGNRLRLMTHEESQLYSRLVPSEGEDMPVNLFRDKEKGWLYVREVDSSGTYMRDTHIVAHDEWYEVPNIDGNTGKLQARAEDGFIEMNGKLERLSVSELNSLQDLEPSAALLNKKLYEKVYVTNFDTSRTIEYAPKIIKGSMQQINGRNTWRWDVTSNEFHETGKIIDASGHQIGLPGGVFTLLPDRALEFLNFKQPEGANYRSRLSYFSFIDEGVVRTKEGLPGLYKVQKNIEGQSVSYYQIYFGKDVAGREVVLDNLEKTSDGYRTIKTRIPEGLTQSEMSVLKKSLPDIKVTYDDVSGIWSHFYAADEAFMDIPLHEFNPALRERNTLLSSNGSHLKGLFVDTQNTTHEGRKLVWAEAGILNGKKAWLHLEQDGAQENIFWQRTTEGYRKFIYSESHSGLQLTVSGAKEPITMPPLLPQTFVDLPIDGFPDNVLSYFIDKDGYKQMVAYDATLKTWRATAFYQDAPLGNPQWWNGVEFESGTIKQFKQAKSSGLIPEPRQTRRIQVLGNLPELPPQHEMFMVPKKIHYIWLRNAIPENIINNLLINEKRSGEYASILHLDVSDSVYESIKERLKSEGSAIQISNIREEPFYRDFKQTASGFVYDKAVNGDYPNCSLASDILRYRYDGVYMDCDDQIQWTNTLYAAKGDFLLSNHVMSNEEIYNGSHFASLEKSLVRDEIIAEIERRSGMKKYQEMVSSPRPYQDDNGKFYQEVNGVKTQVSDTEFINYRKAFFDFAGPSLISGVVKKMRPDYYDAYMLPNRYPASLIRLIPADQVYQDALDHYFPFKEVFKINTGAESSWLKTR